MKDYAGEYEHPLYGSFFVECNDDALRYNFNQTPYFNGRLNHWHYDSFLLLPDLQFRDEAIVQFQLSADGSITEVGIDGAFYKKK